MQGGDVLAQVGSSQKQVLKCVAAEGMEEHILPAPCLCTPAKAPGAHSENDAIAPVCLSDTIMRDITSACGSGTRTPMPHLNCTRRSAPAHTERMKEG